MSKEPASYSDHWEWSYPCLPVGSPYRLPTSSSATTVHWGHLSASLSLCIHYLLSLPSKLHHTCLFTQWTPPSDPQRLNSSPCELQPSQGRLQHLYPSSALVTRCCGHSSLSFSPNPPLPASLPTPFHPPSSPPPSAGWADRVFFSDNGSTAIEVAQRMAFRAFCHRHGIHRPDTAGDARSDVVYDLKVPSGARPLCGRPRFPHCRLNSSFSPTAV